MLKRRYLVMLSMLAAFSLLSEKFGCAEIPAMLGYFGSWKLKEDTLQINVDGNATDDPVNGIFSKKLQGQGFQGPLNEMTWTFNDNHTNEMTLHFVSHDYRIPKSLTPDVMYYLYGTGNGDERDEICPVQVNQNASDGYIHLTNGLWMPLDAFRDSKDRATYCYQKIPSND